MTYFTSDLHLGHENIIRFSNRPFSTLDEMNRTLVDNWNSRVTERDDVFVLGDMFYRKILEYSLIVSQIKADSWRFETASERYHNLLKHHPEVIKRAPMAHIASYLLMTPETLSRVRSNIQ